MKFVSLLAVAAFLLAAPAHAQFAPPVEQNVGFASYLPRLRALGQAAGVSQRTLDSVFPALQFSSRTVELDRAQPGGVSGSTPAPPFAPYYRDHVTAALIERGRARYAALRPQLARVEARYGVPGSVAMAIFGHETSYGTVTGDFDLLNSLASLAYDGRRRALFEGEFIATLKMLDRGYPRSLLRGSWAGATGYPQFLPSVYLRLAADADGDGRADIWRSQADALASIANYLSNAGWKRGASWGMRAAVPIGFDRASVRSTLAAPRCARVHARHSRWLTVGEWRRRGVQPLGGIRDEELASLLEPDGPGRTAYLLTGNYRAILDYNCSNFYALSVGLLADEIAR
ncbi:MAG: GH103 [uncultured Sphingomonadaceae bacterium]|uniref:GH103 n=1 Tax=uncultured Sphingomonadaceae bacterium TaxID=169976 RepID=A0A6J4TIR3_9SPHN|nr:MAG: GH103 [uncultured Sphingomonadaceae bacterium]